MQGMTSGNVLGMSSMLLWQYTVCYDCMWYMTMNNRTIERRMPVFDMLNEMLKFGIWPYVAEILLKAPFTYYIIPLFVKMYTVVLVRQIVKVYSLFFITMLKVSCVCVYSVSIIYLGVMDL